ncbi:nuclear transport factor 2 family protein [uncultured Limosilactobacillus sp.]|mgnify:FL=1|uniref:nuclear transport factor 2 family protein n=1 Tax=uncultured Limosilactobacillus sp. TaxID=2837629 RepID=UPI0025F113EB|nr:nuclear transport factor 2 family protein [uncultured Limosilactobacillus sp.]
MSDEEQIISLYRQENEAMVKKDLVTLNQILAPSMNLVHMTGMVQPKLEWIDQIQNGQMKYFDSQEEHIFDVVIDGDQASLIGQNLVRASVWGGGVTTWPLQIKMEFQKINGQWLITYQIASTY